MSVKQVSVLNAEPKPIDGDYGYKAVIIPGALSLVLSSPVGTVYAQAIVALPADFLKLDEAKREAAITRAGKTAARLINAWGNAAKDAERALGVPVTLDPETVITEESCDNPVFD
jgi:hypothetical protein